MRRFRLLLLAGVALWACGLSCWDFFSPPQTDKPRVAALRGFDSAEELRTFLVEQADTRLNADNSAGGWSWFGVPLGAAPAADRSDGPAAPTAGEAGGGDQSFSTTNIQEVGVDESDIVKNDGRYIYWLRGDRVHIVDAAPPAGMAKVGTVVLDSPGTALYLRGQTLIVLSNRYSYWYGWGGGVEPGMPVFLDSGGDVSTSSVTVVGGAWNDGGEVTVTILDVSDPTDPQENATVRFEGQLASSRLIDERLYLVLTSEPRIPANPTPAALDEMSLDDWLPDYEITDSSGQRVGGDIAPWQSFYRPEFGDGYAITTAVTLDVDNPTAEFKSTAITANAGTIYASTEALYVTDTSYDWDLLSSRTDTMVHKLAFSEAGTEYVASGLVPGRPLNQYSMGEYEGYLRIATTQENFSPGGPASTNGVYVLGENGATLDTVGQVEDLGLNETIYAARFIGDRGFLVTFRRIDPLFTMDLSNPADPKVVGQLKVPGYSDHIQLLDEDHLLTIGKDAQDAGSFAWVQGVQLSIFDVSDMANPTRLHKEVIGGRGTHSEANNDPKAFNYFPTRGVLAFPIDLYGEGTTGPEYGDHDFTGLLVYSVSVDTGFEELGRIATVADDQASRGCFWNYWGSTRGVFINDHVYAVSDLGVKAAALPDVSTIVGNVVFTDSSPQRDCYTDFDILPVFGEGLR